jgi:two-component system sensor histidine kinase KdpD
MPDHRPNPNVLLATLHQEEARASRGRLKIFFGMCPGVGKTYAMLKAARQELHDGQEVVAGIVETHGRAETEALLVGLPVIPRKQVEYRGAQLKEMDLEAVLARRPKLVLVDELAHANAPESRHPKRYQDVIELLDAGIDVFTTLNVQHVESRADAVRQITSASVHETVPDSILELADQIELVDITAEALLERLREGKVYLGDQAQTAAENFFQDTKLTALRELALRFTAERVEKRLRELRARSSPTIWRSGERLLVAVGPSPTSRQLVRWTRRMAASQGASWIAVSVESSRPLEDEAKRTLDHNLALARELGAEVIVTHSDDITDALVRVALQNNATQIVVGKSRNPRWLDRLRGGNLADRLLHAHGPFDLYVVPDERAAEKPARTWIDWHSAMSSPLHEYGAVFGAMTSVSFMAWPLTNLIGYRSIGVIFLLTVIGLSLRLGRGPLLFAGVLAALVWDYFFIPPRFTFVIGSVEDAALYTATIIAALVSGQLTARIRDQARHERMREERATALFHLTRALSAARTLDEGVFAALRQADTLFKAQTALLIADDSGESLIPHFADSFTLDEKERSVADWAWRKRKNAGRFSNTLPMAEGFHVPLLREDRAIGVFVVRVAKDATLTLAQRDLIESYAAQLALLVEREQLRAVSEREKLLAESDKLHRALLDGVSHELKTPLAVLSAAAENLPTETNSPVGRIVQEIRTATRRLNRLVGNLIDQTRLETGMLRPKIDWCDANDLLNAATDGISESLAGHPLEVDVPDDMPLFRADAAIMELVLANLLLNAALHTPSGTPLFLATGIDRAKNRIFFTVADRGPGLPPEIRSRLFKKFQRGDTAHAGGLGLGLSIIHGFVVAQDGEIVAGENPGGGAVFTVYLPHQTHETVPDE